MSLNQDKGINSVGHILFVCGLIYYLFGMDVLHGFFYAKFDHVNRKSNLLNSMFLSITIITLVFS